MTIKTLNGLSPTLASRAAHYQLVKNGYLDLDKDIGDSTCFSWLSTKEGSAFWEDVNAMRNWTDLIDLEISYNHIYPELFPSQLQEAIDDFLSSISEMDAILYTRIEQLAPGTSLTYAC